VAGGPGGARLNAGAFTQIDDVASAASTSESLGASGGAGAGIDAGAGGNNSSFFGQVFYLRSPLSGPSPTDWTGIWDGQLDLMTYITVGCGGGGGNAVSGGTGGAGGGIVRIRAPRVINNGLISANGGNGSAGTASGGSGGGGGGGGRIVIVGKRSGSGTYTVTGGTGGAGNGAGSAGSNGSNGTTHFYG
jgi:hypothetical protein